MSAPGSAADPGVRLVRCPPQDLADLAANLDPWLRPQGPPLAAEYPLLFRDDPRVGHYCACGPDGALLAHAATLIRELVGGEGRSLPIGMISTVVTRQECRGRGLASSLLERACQELRSAGCVVTLVWSDRESFYARFGLHRLGRELIWGPTAAALAGRAATPVPATGEHLEGILALHRARTPRVERSREELAALLTIPCMETLVALDPEQRVQAYLCLGKGLDFQGVIHETGGSAEAVEALLTGLVRARPELHPALLMSPADRELADRLAARGLEPAAGALGLGRVEDRQALESFAATLTGRGEAFRGDLEFLPFHLGGLDSV